MRPEETTQLDHHDQRGEHRTSEYPHERARDRAATDNTPHVDLLLTSLLRDPARLGMPETQREIGAVARHLGECEHCQVALEALLSELAERTGPQSERGAASLRLLARLREVGGRARARRELTAYALKWCALGEDAARAAFPETSEHLATCAICRREVVERLGALRAQMDALLAPRLDAALPPLDAAWGPLGDEALRLGVERLARTAIRVSALSGARQVTNPTIIVSIGAEAGEISAVLGHEVLELSAEDRQRVALVSIELAEPAFAWRSLRREQRERHLVEQGPWLAEVCLDGPRPLTRRATTTMDAPGRASLAEVLGETLRALPLAGAEASPRVLLLAPLAEPGHMRRAIEIVAMLRDVASQQGITPHVTLLCVPSGAAGLARDGGRSPHFTTTLGAVETRLSPAQRHRSSAFPAALFDAVWLAGVDGVPRGALARALSRQLRAWLCDTPDLQALVWRQPRQRSAAQGRKALRVTASMAAEVVFPLEETALAFALRSAAAVLPELAEREGLTRRHARAPQQQLIKMAAALLAECRGWARQMPDVRHLFALPGQGGDARMERAFERLYTWATMEARPGTAAGVRADEDPVAAAHMDACLEALRVARRDAPLHAHERSGEDDREVASEETMRWLALTLVGYFRWLYGEKLGALDLCELLLRAGEASTLEACAALLARHALTLQRWLESATPYTPDGMAPARAPGGTLCLAMRGQSPAAWSEMADSLRGEIGQALGARDAVTLDTTLADPHRLRLWFARPPSDLLEQADPLAWLAARCGAVDERWQEWRGRLARMPQRGVPPPLRERPTLDWDRLPKRASWANQDEGRSEHPDGVDPTPTPVD